MMSANKAALKAAKAAIEAHRYPEAEKEARKVLGSDPNNYHANVFLGLALSQQSQEDEAAKAYLNASETKPRDPLVWQGLVALYEKQGSSSLGSYEKAALRLAEAFKSSDDGFRCVSIVERLIAHTRECGTRSEYRRVLEKILPGTELGDFLDGKLPNPAQTFAEVAEIEETEENERINKLIGERRTRIGARISQVTAETKLQVFRRSRLEAFWNDIVNWTHDDATRRRYEEKLLQRAFDILLVLQGAEKTEQRARVQKLAEGMTILKHPFHLAWRVILEWKDVETIAELDTSLLKDYMTLFPDDGLTKILKGFVKSHASPFPPGTLEETPEEPANDGESQPTTPVEDHLQSMTDGLEQSAKSILSNRLMALYYLDLQEYGSALDCSKKALELEQLESDISGLPFQENLDALNVTRATALIHYQTPRHHPEAKRAFTEILQRKSSNKSALIGIGLILEEDEEYAAAVDFLKQALRYAPTINVRSEAAWCSALSGDYEDALRELQLCLQDLEASEHQDRELKAVILYRIGMCMWKIDTSKAGRKNRNGPYSKFIASLNANLNYAPPYTSLGIFYSDYAKDRVRARKCFQKAFELSPGEIEAAERLAKLFANESNWDLVELVASRVIDSGKVRPPPGSRKKGFGWPFAALGTCELNRQDYAKSASSFQLALRIANQDYHSWVGLGESYHNSGRYIAATRAFQQAQQLKDKLSQEDQEAFWFSEFMLANVHRELGEFDEAVRGYKKVLQDKQDEFGVLEALLQTYVESARHSIELGHFGDAALSCHEAIKSSRKVVGIRSSAFNIWKAIGDACSLFSLMQSNLTSLPVGDLLDTLRTGSVPDMFEYIAEIDKLNIEDILITSGENDAMRFSIQTAILAYKRAIFSSRNDLHAQAAAWYNLGWAEYQASIHIHDTTKKANPFLRASVHCFKRAIELEAGNSEFWNALGIVTIRLDPKVAQHAFVRSLFLNERSARTWTNLGTLCLLHNDNELANEVFTRGQSTDPEYSHAWLGQGILAMLIGDPKEAQSLFTHAFEISDSLSLIVKELFASSTFDALSTDTELSKDIASILQPLFALHQLNVQKSDDIIFIHLSALLAEQLGDVDNSLASLSLVCKSLETDYESSESELAMFRFSQAKADLARAKLAVKEFEEAAEDAEMSLNLSEVGGGATTEQTERGKYRLSAYLTAGLALYHSKSIDRAIQMFRSALEESKDDPNIVCTLVQILWAKGGKEERGVALDQLFYSVEKHPHHPGILILLTVVALLTGDSETLELARDELHNLRTRDDVDAPQKLRIGSLIAAAARLRPGQEDAGIAERAEAMASVMLCPWQPQGWSQLALLPAQESESPAQMALMTALHAVPPKGVLDAEDLARAYSRTGLPADGQRSIMLSPWLSSSWQSLVESCS